MSLPHPLPDDLVELIARRFRVIGEPMRIRLLDRLRAGEASVNELAAALGASQQNVSKHLGVLADVGILGRRKDGNHVYYRIVDEGVFGLCEQVCGSLQQQLAHAERGRRRRAGRLTASARSGRLGALGRGGPLPHGRDRLGRRRRRARRSSRRRSRPRSPAPAGRRTARSRSRRETLVQAGFAGLLELGADGRRPLRPAHRATTRRSARPSRAVAALLRANDRVASVQLPPRGSSISADGHTALRHGRREGRPDRDGRRRRRAEVEARGRRQLRTSRSR